MVCGKCSKFKTNTNKKRLEWDGKCTFFNINRMFESKGCKIDDTPKTEIVERKADRGEFFE